MSPRTRAVTSTKPDAGSTSKELSMHVPPWEVDRELYSAWKAVEASLEGVVAECMRTNPEEPWTVLCVGHSMGAAVATIAAQALAVSACVLASSCAIHGVRPALCER
jgi:alpha-beta hydrolase superfamily lysophospholipase